MTTQEIVSKLWNLCDILWDDGVLVQRKMEFRVIYVR